MVRWHDDMMAREERETNRLQPTAKNDSMSMVDSTLADCTATFWLLSRLLWLMISIEFSNTTSTDTGLISTLTSCTWWHNKPVAGPSAV